MNIHRLCKSIYWIMLAGSIGFLLLSLNAESLGLDVDGKWGEPRVGLFLIGGIGILVSVFLILADKLDKRHAIHNNSVESLNLTEQELQDLHRTQSSEYLEKVNSHKETTSIQTVWTRNILILSVILLAEVLYVWFISAGFWSKWPDTSDYYAQLAESFTHGQIALLTEPSPQLAELENPYPSSERPDIPVIQDASYYRGKYYLYWGPIPAVGVALGSFVSGNFAGDQMIVFIAISTIMIASVLILLFLKKTYFSKLPNWLLGASILMMATAHPMLWMLNTPHIHEAAIASGQAFLIAGLFFALPVITSKQFNSWRLILVGILWACAVGSRLTLFPVILFLVFALGVKILNQSQNAYTRKTNLSKIFILILPIGLSLILLTVYNYLRFDNFLETGLRFQMSYVNLNNLIETGHLFNPIYSLPNIFYYVLLPWNLRSGFPFIRPLFQKTTPLNGLMNTLNIPENYRVEDAVGLLFAMPMIILFGYVVFTDICDWDVFKRGITKISGIQSGQLSQDFRYLIRVLVIASFIAILPIMNYFWVANRFLLDAIPLIALVSVLGGWLLYASGIGLPFRKSAVVLILVALISVATISGFMLAMTGAYTRFDDLNPVLWNKISSFFTW